MLNRIGNFILYHNGFTLLLWFVLLSGGTALAANSDVRDAVATSMVGSSDTITQINNSLIVNTDIAQFDFALQITGVTEDDFTYYVTYTYRTLEVQGGVWQQVEKADSLTISKSQLGTTDFETFIQQQLAEFIESQRQLLAETQNIERMLGQTPLVVERSYTGLIGRFLDTKEIISEQNAAAAAEAAARYAAIEGATSTPGATSTTNTNGDTTPSTGPGATSTPDQTGTSTATSTATSTPDGTAPDEPKATGTTTDSGAPDMTASSTVPADPPADTGPVPDTNAAAETATSTDAP